MKKILLTILLFLIPLTASAEVRFDVTKTKSGSAVNTLTTNAFTVAQNATALLVGADIGNTVPALATVTCNGVSLTNYTSIDQSTTRRAEWWYVIGNTVPKGSVTCTPSFSAAVTADLVVGAVSVTGSDPRGVSVGLGTAATNSAASGSATVTVSGFTSDLFVETCGCGDTPTANGASQTNMWRDTTPSTISGDGSYAAGVSPNLAMTVTMSSASFAIAGVAIKSYPQSGEFMSMSN